MFCKNCPLKLEKRPDKVCPLGTPNLDENKKITKEPKCPWWLNATQFLNCFWVYVKENSQPDGSMYEVQQLELAKLLGSNLTKVQHDLKEALTAFKTELQNHEFDLSEDPETDYFLPIDDFEFDI